MQTGTSIGGGASLGLEERARANGEILVTVTRTQIATQTAVVKEVAVTALIYVLSYPDPSLTDAAIGTADPNPGPTSLRAGNGTSISQNPTNQQAASQDQAEMLQAFKDGYALGKEMENPCGPARAPAVGAVGKRADVRKDLGDGVLDLLGVGPDKTGSGHKLRRQSRDGLEKREGGGHGGGGGGGHGGGHGGRGSAHTDSDIVGSATSSATHTTALHNLLITALVIGFLVFGAGASTADFSGSSSAISISIGPKASDPTETLPSNSSSFITNTSRSPTNLRLDSLTRLEKRKGGVAGAAAVIASGATARPNSPSIRLFLVVALLFVLFTTRVKAGTTAELGSVIVDNLAVTRPASATVPETLRSREVEPISTEADTAPSGLGNSDEGKKRHKGGVFISTGASPRSTAPTRWVFWIIVLVTSLTTIGANATHVHSGINSTAITEPVYSVDKSPTRFASPNQSSHHETKRIINKSPTPFIAARQHLSGGGYDITPGNVNGPGYHIEPNQLCSAEYNYNCGDASLGARTSIKLALLALYFLFGWGFVGAAGSAITTTRDTTDFLDLEDTSPTYPPSDTCTTTTSLPAFVSGTGSPDTEMDARPTKHVRFLLGNERRSSIPEEKGNTRFKQDLIKGGEGRSTKPKPKPKDNTTRRARSHSAPILRKNTSSILTTASIALFFAISISGCTALPSLSTPEASSTISLPTHILRSVDTAFPSSTALAHREEQGKSQHDDQSKRQSGGTSGSGGGDYSSEGASAPKPRPRSLLWSSIPLLLILLNYITGATASDNVSALEPLSTNSTQPCEDGLDPSPIDSPPNATTAANDQQAGTLQAAQAAEGFPVTSGTPSNTKNTTVARRVATGATLHNTSKATRSSLPSPLLLFGILALFFATQTSALTLGSSAMARRALPDIHARSHRPDRSATEPEPVPVILPQKLEMSETVVTRSDSIFEYCVQMTDEEGKEDCYEYISVQYGLERSETVAFRSDSRLGDGAQIPGEEEEGCYEGIEDGVGGVSDEAGHRSLAVRSTPTPVPVPNRTPVPVPDVRGNSAADQCNSLPGEEKEGCYEGIDDGVGGANPDAGRRNLAVRSTPTPVPVPNPMPVPVPDVHGNSAADQCNSLPGEEQEGCYEGIDDGVGGANPDAGRRNLAVRSTPTPVPVPDVPANSAADQCNHMSDKGERENCLAAVAAGPAPNTLGNSRAERCNQISDQAAREACLNAGAIHPRIPDAAETIARREDFPGDECLRLPTEKEQHFCLLEVNDGVAKRDQHQHWDLGGDDSNPTDDTDSDIARRDLTERLQARWERQSNKALAIGMACTVVVSILIGLFIIWLKRRPMPE